MSAEQREASCGDLSLATYFVAVALLSVAAVISSVTVYRLIKFRNKRSGAFPLPLFCSTIAMYTCTTLQFVFLVAARADICLGAHPAVSYVILDSLDALFHGYHWCFFDLVLYYRLKIVFAATDYAVSRKTSCAMLSCLAISLLFRFVKTAFNILTDRVSGASSDGSELLLVVSLLINIIVTLALSVMFLRKLYAITRDYLASNQISIGGAKVDLSGSGNDVAKNYAIIIRNTILSVTSSLVTILFIGGLVLVAAVPQAFPFVFILMGLDIFTNVVCISLSLPFFNSAYARFCGWADRRIRACCKRCNDKTATKNEKNLVMMANTSNTGTDEVAVTLEIGTGTATVSES